jgi:hypothetical protein
MFRQIEQDARVISIQRPVLHRLDCNRYKARGTYDEGGLSVLAFDVALERIGHETFCVSKYGVVLETDFPCSDDIRERILRAVRTMLGEIQDKANHSDAEADAEAAQMRPMLGQPRAWTASVHTVGCMPDSEEDCATFLAWDEAAEFIRERLDEANDANAENAEAFMPDDVNREDAESVLSETESALAELAAIKVDSPNLPFGIGVELTAYTVEPFTVYDDDDERRLSLMEALGRDETGPMEDMTECDWSDDALECEAGTFRVLSDEEVNDACREYIGETLWAFNADFLANYMPAGLTSDDVEALRGDRCEDVNDAFRALVGDRFEDLVSDAVAADGAGHFLATYDGEEHENADASMRAFRID